MCPCHSLSFLVILCDFYASFVDICCILLYHVVSVSEFRAANIIAIHPGTEFEAADAVWRILATCDYNVAENRGKTSGIGI